MIMAEYVAWTMLDGNTMCGKVVEQIGKTTSVRRIDGTCVNVNENMLRLATTEDVDGAIDFYRTLGQ